MRIVLKTGLGRRISDLRQDHDMTQDDLADRIGVTGSTIQRWETGQTKIDPDGLLKLSKEFNVSVDWLLMGVGTENLAFSRETGLSETSINEFKNNKKLSTAVNYLTNVGCANMITAVSQYLGFSVQARAGRENPMLDEAIDGKALGQLLSYLMATRERILYGGGANEKSGK